MACGCWILQQCDDERFPYRLQILGDQEPPLVLRTQDRWPGAGKNIFCLREKEPPAAGEVLREIERVPIVALHGRGRRISIVLDRKRYKRCDFLFLSKTYKHRPGEAYEQIFWMTQKSLQQRRPSIKLSLRRGSQGFTVRISSDERYPWHFPQAQTERGPLPAGDYALVKGADVLAVVERKTFDNLLGDFGVMPVLHQRMAELTTYEHHALVIEAAYADFLNPKKVRFYTPAFCAQAIAELSALHPRLHLVFCTNRKIANERTRHCFDAVWRRWVERNNEVRPLGGSPSGEQRTA